VGPLLAPINLVINVKICSRMPRERERKFTAIPITKGEGMLLLIMVTLRMVTLRKTLADQKTN
jgi:hypothetical protein